MLGLLPDHAYRVSTGYLGYSRRSILVVNEPALVREVLIDAEEVFPKSDLMVDALAPLIGDSIFVSSGARWRRQRAMIDPAFSHMRLSRAFTAMQAGVDAYERRLDALSVGRETFSLDLAMGQLTADIICRTVFSTSLKAQIARDVFDDFTLFERDAAHVEIKRLIFDPPFRHTPQHPDVLDACVRIRRHLGALVDEHLSAPGDFDDIAADVIAARDPASGEGFTREELIDQLGVFFLAGHETTASALTWAFYILATQADVRARARAEVEAAAGDGPITFETAKNLSYIQNVFRETLRLYPPITFLPRVARRRACIGPRTARPGAMVMVAPWVIHRHEKLWRAPHAFDPDRFAGDDVAPGAYLPFGFGPRVCVGAGFATTEATLILARLMRRYDFDVLDPDEVRPAARLTTRPREQILCRVRRRDVPADADAAS